MERRDAQNRTGANKALVVHYQLLSSYSEVEDVPYQGDVLNFFRPPFIYQKQTGANKVTPTDHSIPSHFEYPERLAGAPGALIFFCPPSIYQKQIGANKVTPTDNPHPSHFEYPERLAGAPGALIFFCPPFIHQKQIGANKVRVVRHQLLSSYSVPGGVPCQVDACRGVLHTPPYHSRRECLRVGGSFVPFRGTYKGAYAIRPYPAGRKKNQCPSGLPLPIHFSNLAHHTLCFSFK